MTKPSKRAQATIPHEVNPDVSWLAFNMRVLHESMRSRHPLFERLRFLGISGTNLDEFFRVRLSRLKSSFLPLQAKVSRKHWQQVYGSVLQHTRSLLSVQDKALKKICKELKTRNVFIALAPKDLKAHLKEAEACFRTRILPVLTPYIMDPTHPFPFVPNQALGLLLSLDLKGKKKWGLLLLPESLTRFWKIPTKKGLLIVPTEVLVQTFLTHIFKNISFEEVGIFRLLRTAALTLYDMDLEEDEILKEFYQKTLKKRRYGEGVQLTVNADMSTSMRRFLLNHLEIPPELCFENTKFVGMGELTKAIDNSRPELLFPPLKPRNLAAQQGSFLSTLKKQDIILHHPYDSFEGFLSFLQEAVRDPNVLVIKQTLYRTGNPSPIVQLLQEAAENGKTVIALIELKARFDEEINLHWANSLEKAGVQVFYGLEGLKTHAKMSLILRQEKNDIKGYAHFSTGNYNPTTARIYTDVSYFTSQPELVQDAQKIFNSLTSSTLPETPAVMSIAPYDLRERLLALIDHEIEIARMGQPAEIWGKMNALTDPILIQKLYEAAQAGVQIRFIVRGVCCLIPDKAGLSGKINVKSLVGRFLEHTRIFCFSNGGAMASPKARVFISSADWMPRNLDRRIEIMLPIKDMNSQNFLLNLMKSNLLDTENSWVLNPNGKYAPLHHASLPFDAQTYFCPSQKEQPNKKTWLASTQT